MPEETGPAAPVGEFRRTEDFTSVYANNIQFETSVWDLKIILGELDQRGGKLTVEQHTAVSVPWMQAKLLCYFLRMSIEFHEINNGKIPIAKGVLPPPPPPLPPELENDPVAKASFDAIKKLHAELMASL